MYRVGIEAEARDNLRAHYRNLQARSPSSAYAAEWYYGIRAAIRELATSAEQSGLAYGDRFFAESIRQRRFDSYKVLFTIRGDSVRVLHIRHGAQAPEDLFAGAARPPLQRHALHRLLCERVTGYQFSVPRPDRRLEIVERAIVSALELPPDRPRMRYLSTRDPSHSASLDEAVQRGLAPDGGLYVPERFPAFSEGAFEGRAGMAEVGETLLAPFFRGSALEADLPAICRGAFDFPVPLRPLRDGTAVLELFHGPTAAFKDVGARFLAECLTRLRAGQERPLLLLVATSGDTGGAVAAAFHGRPGVEVAILFPEGRVSPRQEKQLTVWGGNVRSFAVRGDFDDCQRMVKAALADPALRARWNLSSANSINLGRLLPQAVYYAASSLEYRRAHGAEPGYVVPSGNVGNATAALWAKRMGLPIREVVLATNANRPLTDFLAGGAWTPSPTVPTLASAMDVGNPSNVERVFHLLGGESAARGALRACRVEDDEIREQIRSGPERWGEVWDPHTATAAAVRERVQGSHWILVATAHPAKFETVTEPLVGREIPVPPALAALLERDGRAEPLEPSAGALREALA